ncbi:MAG: hypothetical protein JETT_0128 [Candidatus Jettenia ecosi]|uniref:Uncharacterized protein n=1 Tax=Candidatus Jettenia ecosi TaxID=2494326 RepID=A0A533QFE4_9BACT|nr:MAG: hypothetical protein JETT_0128 [Candidatus Jettenia ecosi]
MPVNSFILKIIRRKHPLSTDSHMRPVIPPESFLSKSYFIAGIIQI